MKLIVAVDKNWAIGKNNKLMWSIPADMKFFRETTQGNVVIMGRKTLESFPQGQPLKNRVNIVISRKPDYQVKGAVVVHSVEEAVEAAKENAALNGITNCRFIAGDVLKVLDQVEEKPDFIVLDPPRDGIHPKALPKIIQYGVDKLVYISCKPTSLARDLEMFLANGYRVEKACCVDQFCQTVHCETICLLTRNPE